jgi:chitinase
MLKKILLLCVISMLAFQCDLPEQDDIIPPVPLLVFPYEGAVVFEDVQVRIEAADNKKVKLVWVYLDGEFIGETSLRPFLIDMDVNGKQDGLEHVIQVAASDKEDNIGYSAFTRFVIAKTGDIIDPTVSILNPQSGQTVEGTVKVSALADDERAVIEVAFFIDGDSIESDFSYPYSMDWDTTPFADSTNHTIYAKVFDSGKNSSLSPVVTVTVFPRPGLLNDLIPPSVRLIFPQPGYTVSGIVPIRADATDNVEVTSVEFYIDGALDGTGTLDQNTWLYEWDSSAKADTSSHNIFMKAYDAAGNVGSSAVTTVTVVAAP